MLYNKTKTLLIQFPCGAGGDFSIPASVTSIGNYTFSYCVLNSITIPASVMSIGDQSVFYVHELALSIFFRKCACRVGLLGFACMKSAISLIRQPNYLLYHWSNRFSYRLCVVD